VMSREEWREMRSYIKYDFQKDNYFTELKDQEILTSRLSLLGQIDPYINRYYIKKWVQKNVLRMSDEDIEELESEMEESNADELDKNIMAAKSQPESDEQPPQKVPTEESFAPKPLTEEDKRLIDRMTRVLEDTIVSKDDHDILNRF